MCELLVMRHAKSDWDTGVVDHERPLAPRGVRAARSMARFLTESGFDPDLAIASSALRARSTAELVLEHGGFACPLRVEASLYGASPGAVLAVLRTVGPAVGRVLTVGHEPWCSELVALLTGAAVAFPTATVACLDAGVTRWGDLAPGRAVLRWLVPPRVLPHT